MITGHVSVLDDGKPFATMTPAKWFYAKREQEPTTEVAIRRGVGEDVYIVLAGYDAAEQSATYAVTINPLVWWLWFGGFVLVFGGVVTMWPGGGPTLAAPRRAVAGYEVALVGGGPE